MNRCGDGWRHPLTLGLMTLGLLGMLAACGSTAAPTPAAYVVHVAAPASTLPLLHDLAETYRQQAGTSDLAFDLRATNSQLARAALEDGTVDLAVSSWLTSTELPDLAVTPFAWDAVTFVIHPRNPITDITLLQLRDLYRGHTFDWTALGGHDDLIVVTSREDGSGLRAAFEQAVMGGQPVTLGAIVMPSDAAVIDFVAARPAAIGYVSQLGLLTSNQVPQAPAQVKTLPIEGVVPKSNDLLRGGYHLVHPIYLLSQRPPPAALQPFIDFVLSPSGQAVIARYTTGIQPAA